MAERTVIMCDKHECKSAAEDKCVLCDCDICEEHGDRMSIHTGPGVPNGWFNLPVRACIECSVTTARPFRPIDWPEETAAQLAPIIEQLRAAIARAALDPMRPERPSGFTGFAFPGVSSPAAAKKGYVAYGTGGFVPPQPPPQPKQHTSWVAGWLRHFRLRRKDR